MNELLERAAAPVPEQPKFWTVYAAPKHLDCFVVVAILSKREDADAFVAKHEAAGTYEAVAPAEPLAMDVILDSLTRDRLGALAAPITALASHANANAQTASADVRDAARWRFFIAHGNPGDAEKANATIDAAMEEECADG